MEQEYSRQNIVQKLMDDGGTNWCQLKEEARQELIIKYMQIEIQKAIINKELQAIKTVE